MTNAERIKALRNCANANYEYPAEGASCSKCPYNKVIYCKCTMMRAAADALEECMKKENALKSLIDGRDDPVSCNVDAILKGEYDD